MKDTSPKKKKNVHEGHRSRMRNKMLKCGMESLEEHEMLEILLFYSIPRKNTNEIAHKLIKRFGNFANVVDADAESLKEVEGISDNSIALIKAIPQMVDAYRTPIDALKLTDLQELRKFALGRYTGVTNKVLKLVCVSNTGQYVSCIDVCSMDYQQELTVDLKRVIELAEKYNSSILILMHNHPDSAAPSENDIYLTEHIRKTLPEINMTLFEHVIVAGNEVTLIRNDRYLRLPKSPF